MSAAAEYFARDALSNSGIKQILRSPRHFKLWHAEQALRKLNDDLRLGIAVHSYVLDGKRNFPLFTETKSFDSKAGKAFLLHSPDALTPEEMGQVQWMGETVLGDSRIKRLLDSCEREVQIYGQEITSYGMIPTKAMADGMNQRLILDLKTTRESAKDFHWAAKKLRYDIQAAWYIDQAYMRDGLIRDFYFIVIEKQPPFGVLMYQASESFIERGRLDCKRACEIYGRAKHLNEWPSYDTNEILTLT